jgi:hypothetical protein
MFFYFKTNIFYMLNLMIIKDIDFFQFKTKNKIKIIFFTSNYFKLNNIK